MGDGHGGRGHARMEGGGRTKKGSKGCIRGRKRSGGNFVEGCFAGKVWATEVLQGNLKRELREDWEMASYLPGGGDALG